MREQSPPLNLALVTRRYPPLIGGAEKVLSYLALALANEGADVTVVTSQIPKPVPAAHGGAPGDWPVKSGATEDVAPGRLRVIRLATSPLRFFGTWRYMHNLKHWFHANRVDLAYVSMLKHDAYTVLGAGGELGFPVVLRPEGAGATGDLLWQSWGNFGRLIGLRCRQATAFVAISQAIERELREAWCAGTMRPARWSTITGKFREGRRQPRIAAIPNGVPIPGRAWQLRPSWRLAPSAVYLGRFAPEKGLDLLIDAWPLVRAKYAHARLTLIGEGPMQPALEAKISRLGMGPGPGQAIEMRGPVGEASPFLEGADLFILPSREEGMSIALLEAMALGMPLVASSISGNRRLVADFEHGRLAPALDPVALARVIIEQWDHFERAVQMGQRARDRVRECFSIERVARQHLELFEDILECRPPVATS